MAHLFVFPEPTQLPLNFRSQRGLKVYAMTPPSWLLLAAAPAVILPTARPVRIRVPRERTVEAPETPSALWPGLRRIFTAEAHLSLEDRLGAARAADALPRDWSDFAGLRNSLEDAGFR